MRYFLDCEFDGMGGRLLTMALVREDLGYRYWSIGADEWDGAVTDDWVRANVLPIVAAGAGGDPTPLAALSDLTAALGEFLSRDTTPIEIIADWPDDFSYLSPALLTGPGTMIAIPGLTMRVIRVDAWPITAAHHYEELHQHNALHDALALRLKVLELEAELSPLLPKDTGE